MKHQRIKRVVIYDPHDNEVLELSGLDVDFPISFITSKNDFKLVPDSLPAVLRILKRAGLVVLGEL